MLAQEEARRLGHNFVGTEQILLGLIGESTGIAAKVLKSMGVNLKDARVEVEKIIGAVQLACPLEKKHLASLCNTALLSSFMSRHAALLAGVKELHNKVYLAYVVCL